MIKNRLHGHARIAAVRWRVGYLRSINGGQMYDALICREGDAATVTTSYSGRLMKHQFDVADIPRIIHAIEMGNPKTMEALWQHFEGQGRGPCTVWLSPLQ